MRENHTTLDRRRRTGRRWSLAVMAISACGLVYPGMTLAEPYLHLPLQAVTSRAAPLPVPIDPHRGSFKWGNEWVELIALGGELRWEPWTRPMFVAEVLNAMRLVENRAVGNEWCNRYFSQFMPNGRTLKEIWNATGAQRIRISFSPGPSGMWRAGTHASAPFDWTVTENAVRLGPESIASALVHEATRTNGVTHERHVAYGAARACHTSPYVLSEQMLESLGRSVVVLH